MPTNNYQGAGQDPLARYRNSSIDGDTGSFQSLEDIARIEASDGEPIVYGLDHRPFDDPRARRQVPIPLIVGGIVALLAVVGLVTAIRFFRGRNSQNQAAGQVEQEATETDESLEALGAAELEQRVATLDFGNEIVGVSGDGVNISVSDGHVVVTHRIDEATADARYVVDRATQRAAALSASLSNAFYQGEGAEQERIVDVTWVVASSQGATFMALSYPVGEGPLAGDTAELLASSQAYALSDSLYATIGGEQSGLSPRGGGTLTDANGATINPTATYPAAETEETSETEQTSTEDEEQGEYASEDERE